MHTYEAKKMNKNDDVVPVKYDTQIRVYSQLFALFIALGNIIQLQKRAVLTTFAPPYPLPYTPCPACRHLCHLQNKYEKKKTKKRKRKLVKNLKFVQTSFRKEQQDIPGNPEAERGVGGCTRENTRDGDEITIYK